MTVAIHCIMSIKNLLLLQFSFFHQRFPKTSLKTFLVYINITVWNKSAPLDDQLSWTILYIYKNFVILFTTFILYCREAQGNIFIKTSQKWFKICISWKILINACIKCVLNINGIHSKLKWCAKQAIFMIRLFLFDSVFFVRFDAVFQVLQRLYFVFRCSLLDDKTRSISVWDWLKSEKSHFIIFIGLMNII